MSNKVKWNPAPYDISGPKPLTKVTCSEYTDTTRLQSLHVAMKDTHQRLLEMSGDVHNLVDRLLGGMPEEKDSACHPSRSGLVGALEDSHEDLRNLIAAVYSQVDKLKTL